MGWGGGGGCGGGGGGGGGGRALGEGFVIRVVLGLCDGAGDGEEGGVLEAGRGGGHSGMDGSRKIYDRSTKACNKSLFFQTLIEPRRCYQ